MRARSPSSPSRSSRQSTLALEPQPEQVREEAERLMARGYWRRRYRSLEQLQEADPATAEMLWTCAKGAARARLRR